MLRIPILLIVGAAMLAGCAAPAAVPSAPASGLTELTMCWSAPTATQAVPWYAKEKGLFEKYGLNVNLLRVNGSSEAVTTLISGDADFCEAAGSSIVFAVAAGQDAVMIAGLLNTYPAVLVARPQIKTPEDLKGKTIGTSAPGTASGVATDLVLERLGLEPADVVQIQIGNEGERVAAFQAGQIDALLSSPPFLHTLRDQGVSELFDFGKSDIPFAHTSVLTTRAFLKKDRDAATRLMKALIEAIALMKKDREGTQAVMAKYVEMDPVENADDLSDAYDNVVLPLLQDIPYPSMAGLQTLIDAAAADNPDAADLDPAELVDLSILDELEQTGFLKEFQTQ